MPGELNRCFSGVSATGFPKCAGCASGVRLNAEIDLDKSRIVFMSGLLCGSELHGISGSEIVVAAHVGFL